MMRGVIDGLGVGLAGESNPFAVGAYRGKRRIMMANKLGADLTRSHINDGAFVIPDVYGKRATGEKYLINPNKG